MDQYHVPVLLKETIWYLDVRKGRKYIDATIGGGGHAAGILEAGGIVLGIDQDLEAIRYVEESQKLKVKSQKLVLRRGNFAHLKEIAAMTGFHPVSGVLFDLGVSSHQLETATRGFSFGSPCGGAGKEGLLDMRMDPGTQKVTAADLVNAGSEKELANLFWKFGEEREARAIARRIIAERKDKRIETTDQLVKIVVSVRRRGKRDRTHPATRVFQALRIAVNDELSALEEALPQARELLESGGRLVVISFHSLEDRIVKNFMRMNTSGNIQIITNKPVRPSKEEIGRNPRARSGKLRAAEKH